MKNNSNIKEALNGLVLKELTPEEKSRRGILGRLCGPCANITTPTRNGRVYSDELWEKVFQNDIVKEMIANGGIPGELDHPEDRQDICSEKIAIMMPETPKRDKDGHLVAYFDILDTPNGRIAYELAKYGYNLGVSSRGTGDVTEDATGESVDPDTYAFTCFDLVLVPSVKDARLKMTEGLDTTKSGLKQALCESLKKANVDQKKVMVETLKDLNIDFEDECNHTLNNTVNNTASEKIEAKLIDDKCISEKSADKIGTKELNEVEIKKDEATDSGSEILIKSLQEALKSKVELETQVKTLQEKLAVSDAKAKELNEDLNRYKGALVKLSDTGVKDKKLQSKVISLEEELKTKDTIISSQKEQISKIIQDGAEKSEKETKPLVESISSKDREITSLNEALKTAKADSDAKLKDITESLSREKVNSDGLSKKLSKMTMLKESYKKLAENTANRYISSKAVMLGVKPDEIRNKLPQSYTIDNIDAICESLQSYALNMSKLPFNLDRQVKKVTVTESKNDSLNIDNGCDDVVDESLLNIAGLK